MGVRYRNLNTGDEVEHDEPRARLDRLPNWVRVNSPEEAPATPAEDPPADDPPPPTGGTPEEELTALRAEAEALGVNVDGRWGPDRLRQEIAAANGDDPDGD